MPINLDAAKAARREAKKEQPEIVYGKKRFKLPVELPMATMEHLSALEQASKAKDGEAITEAFRGVARSLLGAKFEEFMSLQPSVEDMGALVEGIAAEYGFDNLGESPALAVS